MRGFVIAACVVVLAACAGPGKAEKDTAVRDTTIVPGAPASVAVDPAFLPETTAGRGSSTPVSAGIPAEPGRQSKPAGRPGSTKGQPPVTPHVTPSVMPPVTPSAPVATDSIRGVVSVVGTSFEKRVMVAVPGNGKRVEITGPLASLVGHLAGADLSVVGARSASTIEATSFLVRTVDGMPAIDGILRTEGSFLHIVTRNGISSRIVSPPPPLLGHDGSRVWITGDPSKGVASFGFINPPR